MNALVAIDSSSVGIPEAGPKTLSLAFKNQVVLESGRVGSFDILKSSKLSSHIGKHLKLVLMNSELGNSVPRSIVGDPRRGKERL
jgi:hypothetical protein